MGSYIRSFCIAKDCILVTGRYIRSFCIAKDCLLTLVKSRLALRSTGCLFVRSFVMMPKMAQYTGKWLLTVP